MNIRSKREFSTLPVTPGSNQISPMRKQPRQTSSSTTRSNNDAQDIVKQLKDMIDTKTQVKIPSSHIRNLTVFYWVLI